ncbi:MAG TPA: flagellar basal-body MS-ring/collar protein FliF [Clostridia bacterium]|nr:flagellar basal-body MS-ring/collar protein FliF [Clostridia bacterium]
MGQSIRFLEGVEDAVVTIAMPKSDSFVLKEEEIPVSASAIILPKHGYEITGQQAKSIEQLMSTSVPGLDKENISIIDNKMNILNPEGTQDAQTVTNQFVMQQQLENKIKAEIVGLLEPVFGYGRIKTAVNAKLNFDKRTKESITFEPVMDDSGIIISQELLKEKMSNNPAGGIPGETNNTTQYPEAGIGGDSTSQKDHKKINYEVNEIKEMIEEEQGKLDNLSIAVVIDNDQLDQQTINGVRELVATAMGTDLERVAVQSWEFNTDIQQELLDALQGQSREKPWLNASRAVIIVSSLVIVLALIAILHKSRQSIPVEVMEEYIPEESVAVEEDSLPDIAATEEDKIRAQLNRFAEEQPEEIAQLLRNWLSEE